VAKTLAERGVDGWGKISPAATALAEEEAVAVVGGVLQRKEEE
jgi:hypothetical protein